MHRTEGKHGRVLRFFVTAPMLPGPTKG